MIGGAPATDKLQRQENDPFSSVVMPWKRGRTKGEGSKVPSTAIGCHSRAVARKHYKYYLEAHLVKLIWLQEDMVVQLPFCWQNLTSLWCRHKSVHKSCCTVPCRFHRSVLNQKHIVEERPWNTPLLSFGVLLSWCSAILVLCHSGALPFWCSAILALCHSGTLPWCWPFCWCPQSHCEPAALRQ